MQRVIQEVDDVIAKNGRLNEEKSVIRELVVMPIIKNESEHTPQQFVEIKKEVDGSEGVMEELVSTNQDVVKKECVQMNLLKIISVKEEQNVVNELVRPCKIEGIVNSERVITDSTVIKNEIMCPFKINKEELFSECRNNILSTKGGVLHPIYGDSESEIVRLINVKKEKKALVNEYHENNVVDSKKNRPADRRKFIVNPRTELLRHSVNTKSKEVEKQLQLEDVQTGEIGAVEQGLIKIIEIDSILRKSVLAFGDLETQAAAAAAEMLLDRYGKKLIVSSDQTNKITEPVQCVNLFGSDDDVNFKIDEPSANQNTSPNTIDIEFINCEKEENNADALCATLLPTTGTNSEENEMEQSKREPHLKLQNKVQTLSRTCSELQIESQTNSGDDTGTAGVEECYNKLREDDVNTEANIKNDVVCQHHRKRKSTNTSDRHSVCKVCYKNCTLFHDVKVQKCTHTSERPYVCDTCGKAFTDMANHMIHKRIHTGDRPFGCDTCGKSFTKLAKLKEHKRIHTGDRPYVCDTCGKAFTLMAILKVHKRIHTGDRPYVCDTCGKTFTRMCYLKDHKHIHTGDRPYVCDTCGKAFTHVAILKVHKRIHTGDRPYVCDTCGKTFTRMFSLKDHKYIHTGDRPYVCDTCGKVFTHLSYLTVHKLKHTGERPHVCDTCGKTFTQLRSLKEHKRIHSGERPYVCDTCGKAFTYSSSLKDHKRTHTGDRPYVCDTCGKAFTQPSSLKDHKRIHTGDRPNVCDTCGKAFTTFGNFKRHKRIHTVDRPLVCDT